MSNERLNNEDLRIGGLDMPSLFDSNYSVLKQPFTYPELPLFEDHFSDVTRNNIRIKSSEALLDLTPLGPLTLTRGRPPYIPEEDPAPNDDEDEVRVWVTWGTTNQQLATNWQDSFLFSQSGHVYLEITLRTTGTLVVTETEIMQADTMPTNPEWTAGSARPSTIYYSFGYIFIDGSSNYLTSATGNLVVTEHVSDITPSAGYGGGAITKQLVVTREPY